MKNLWILVAVCLVAISCACAKTESGKNVPQNVQSQSQSQSKHDNTVLIDWNAETITLPPPEKTGGMPLMQALSERKTVRTLSDEKISDRQLSNLLWAAVGVSRPDGKRTSPTAENKQEISVYTLTEHGIHLYDAPSHSLKRISEQSNREISGKQPFTRTTPLVLIYVADMNLVAGKSQEDKISYAAVDTGFIGQNVYLYCTSEGLSSVFLGAIDKDAVHKELKLPEHKAVVFHQCVGWPK